MSPFPKTLLPAARSAYRSVLRASRITFANDTPRRIQMDMAVRQTFSSPTLTSPYSPPSPEEASKELTEADYAKKLQDWVEVAQFLRRNVVQGEMDETGSYRKSLLKSSPASSLTTGLRVTPDTDLGDNTTVKNPAPMPTTPFPNRRRKCGEA